MRLNSFSRVLAAVITGLGKHISVLLKCNNCDFQALTCLCLVWEAEPFPLSGYEPAHRYSVTMPVQTTDSSYCSKTVRNLTHILATGEWNIPRTMGVRWTGKTSLLNQNCPEVELSSNHLALTLISIISWIHLSQLKSSLSLCCNTQHTVTSALTQWFPGCFCGSNAKFTSRNSS